MVSLVVKHTTIGARVLGFDSQAGQIEHSVANDSPPLQKFFGTVLARRSAAEMGPATRHTLRRNTERIMN